MNTGSVGRPKDGDWRAGYVLLTLGNENAGVEFVRVDYDIAATVAGVRAAGLPEDFVEFLQTGGSRWSSVRARNHDHRRRTGAHRIRRELWPRRITAVPARQSATPTISHRSGRIPSTNQSHPSEARM
jgi:hypothetical protein